MSDESWTERLSLFKPQSENLLQLAESLKGTVTDQVYVSLCNIAMDIYNNESEYYKTVRSSRKKLMDSKLRELRSIGRILKMQKLYSKTLAKMNMLVRHQNILCVKKLRSGKLY